MKYSILSITLTFWVPSIFSPGAIHAVQKSLMDELKGVSAAEAVALANKWRWTHKDIKVYVDAQEIVFKFPDGQTKKIPMPDDKMLVAVAPYIKNTHT
jgi:hypothetical protein